MKKNKIILPIIVFAFLFIFTLFYKSFYPKIYSFELNKNANWITYNSESSVHYFRKSFYLSENVKNSWLFIASLDKYEVYLNEKLIGKEVDFGWYPNKIYDLTNELKSGKNLICIKTTSRRFVGDPKIFVELGYEIGNSRKKYVFSDETWKTADFKDINSISGLKWFDYKFNDNNWNFSTLTSGPTKFNIPVNVEAFRTSTDKKNWFWIGTEDKIECFSDIYIPDLPKSAWIRLFSWGKYKLDINDNIISDFSYSLSQLNNSPTNLKILYTYDLSNYLKQGKNKIKVIATRSKITSGLYVDGQISGKNWNQNFNQADFKCFYSNTDKIAEKNILGFTKINFIKKSFPGDGNNYLITFDKILKFSIFLVIFTFALFLLSNLFLKRFNPDQESISFTFFLPSLLLISLLLLSYDKRFDANTLINYKFAIISLVILFFQWSLYPFIKKINIKSNPKLIVYFVLLTIIFFGTYLRFQHIEFEGFHWDEAQMSEKVEGVFKRGYPSLEFADKSPRYISTSELVVYIQSFFALLIGNNEFSLRLPSLIFGVFTIILLFLFGKILGGTRVGLLSASAYAFLPAAIGMSVFARYPSQLAFFSLLSGYFLIKYFHTNNFRYFALTAIALIFSYFSWQASIFLVFPIFISQFIYNKKINLKHSSYFLSIFFIPILIHIIVKKISKLSIHDHSLFGPSLSLKSFKLNFLSSTFDPYFYFKNYLFVEGFHFLTFLLFIGFPIIFFRSRIRKNLIFLYFIIIFVVVSMTSILANNAYRYTFYLTPYLILIASMTLIYLIDYIYGSKNNRLVHIIIFSFSFAFFVIFTSSFVSFNKFQEYNRGLKTNLDLREFPDFKEAAIFLNNNVKDEDVVISVVPHLNVKYFKKLDYFFESRLRIAVYKSFVDGNLKTHHKVIPIPAILSVSELKSVILSTKGKIWLIASPEVYKLYDNETINFFEKSRKIVFESFGTKIYLIKN